MTTRIKKGVMSAGILGITFLFANLAFSWTNDLESYLDSISYYDLQVGAVTTDIHLYFAWLPDEKEAMKKASDKAILRLKYIKEQVENLDTPKVCKDILEGIVNGNDYSPVLFDAFLRWRTLTQSLEYGMSNFSKIPN